MVKVKDSNDLLNHKNGTTKNGTVKCEAKAPIFSCLRYYLTFLYSLLIMLLLCPYSLPIIVGQTIGPVIVTLILKNHSKNNNVWFNNMALNYIGDFSYVLYLVHWPIIEFVKYYSNGKNWHAINGVFI